MNELKEKIARAISTTRGDDFDAIPADKREWIDCRGKVSGRFRDVNEPFKDDYIDMADAVLRAIEEAGYVVMPIALLKALDSPPMSGVEKRLIECETELSKPLNLEEPKG